MKTPWYESAFGADYAERYSHRSDEAAAGELPFLLRALDLPRGSLVLDLCCGAGRHSRALGGAGLRVAGLDLSPALLQVAHARGSTSGTTAVRYLRGDMRRLPFADASLDGVVSMFTSFGYFPRASDDRMVLREVARVLKPGAPFILDYFNLRHVLAHLVARSEKTVGGELLIERRRFDKRSRRLIKTIRKAGEKSPYRVESVRGYSAAELKSLFSHAGLRVVESFGNLFGAPFDARKSPRCVILARPCRIQR